MSPQSSNLSLLIDPSEIELPPELLAELPPEEGAEQESDPLERLRAFGRAVATKRDEAVAYRATTGIEWILWRCEEAYLGIDDANRGQAGKSQMLKPTTMDGPLRNTGEGGGQDTTEASEEIRSTVFIPITRRYVDAGYAKVCEILVSPDDKSFSMGPTPVPDLIKDQNSLELMLHPDGPYAGQPMERDMTPEEMNAAGITLAPGAIPPGVPVRKKDLVAEAIDIATQKAKKAEKRIWDWMVECKYRREIRKVIFDAARLGVGVLKGPFPDYVRSKSMQRTETTVKGGRTRVVIQIKEELKPAAKWVSPWNLFPDPSCGENIHDGDYIFERDYFSRRQLRDLKMVPGYHQDLIDELLKEGPGKSSVGSVNPTEDENTKDRFEVFFFYGVIEKKDLALLNPDAADDVPEEAEQVHAIVTLVNDKAIYATEHPLDSGSFPYHTCVWQRRAGSWVGVGVGEQVDTPQRIINGAARAMMDNAGQSSGSQIVIDRSAVAPADEQWQIGRGNKIWLMQKDAAMDDVQKAFITFEIPMRTAELMQIIQFGLRMAEESSSIPLITQGQSGTTTPDTYGAAQLQNNNANQLLRSIGYRFDDDITEPIVRDLYEWLLLDPDVPDDEKGDFQITANGSVALVERAIQDQGLWQLNEMAISDPAKYGIDPKKWFDLMMKTRRLDPRDVKLDQADQDKLDQAPPPVPYQVQVAQLKVQAEARERALDRQLALQLAQIQLQAEAQMATADHQARLAEIQKQSDMAILDFSNRRGIAVDQVKQRLASDAMRLQVQKELAGLRAPKAAPQVARPATEPPGRAPAGESFQR